MSYDPRHIEWRSSSLRCWLAVAGLLAACGSSSTSVKDAGDASSSDATLDGQASDTDLVCSHLDGGAPGDGGTFNGVCPTSGCPAGTVCVVETGGTAGGGGEYCAPIPRECHGTPTCACMGSCVCTNTFGGRPERCSEENGSIACFNGTI
jgi:hypothetical protein